MDEDVKISVHGETKVASIPFPTIFHMCHFKACRWILMILDVLWIYFWFNLLLSNKVKGKKKEFNVAQGARVSDRVFPYDVLEELLSRHRALPVENRAI